jgi:hypothetical protein
MEMRDLMAWVNEQIAETTNDLSATTDELTVANLVGKVQAWEAVLVQMVRPDDAR